MMLHGCGMIVDDNIGLNLAVPRHWAMYQPVSCQCFLRVSTFRVYNYNQLHMINIDHQLRSITYIIYTYIYVVNIILIIKYLCICMYVYNYTYTY